MKKEMLGQRFGKLTVIGEDCSSKKGLAMWTCQCDCGNITKPVSGYNLRSGQTKSCGCLISESVSMAHKKHGKCNTKLYYVWRSMKNRCYYEKHKNYKNYGGRGITVCEEWKNNFEAFHSYVSQLPHFGEEGRSLDRIDNDGNYEPGNVRWATMKEQLANRRINAKQEVSV